MPVNKNRLTPEQLILRTIVLSALAHVLFLSFNWYQKSENERSNTKLRVTVQPFLNTEIITPEPTESFKQTEPEEIASSQPVSSAPEFIQAPVEKSPSVLANETSNYGQIQASLTGILTTNDPQNNTSESCSDKSLCIVGKRLELDEDRFGFRAAMAGPANVVQSQLEPIFDESEANSNLLGALSISDSVDQTMVDSTQLYLSDLREQRKLQDCLGEKEGAACKGEVNLVTLLKLSSKIIEKVIEE